jgi:hypothetical protein
MSDSYSKKKIAAGYQGKKKGPCQWGASAAVGKFSRAQWQAGIVWGQLGASASSPAPKSWGIPLKSQAQGQAFHSPYHHHCSSAAVQPAGSTIIAQVHVEPSPALPGFVCTASIRSEANRCSCAPSRRSISSLHCCYKLPQEDQTLLVF